MIRASVVGATGYTGEELVSVLTSHKDVKIGCLSAIIDKPTNISDLFPRLKGRIDMICKGFDFDETVSSSDVVFLALPHKVSMEFAPKFLNAGKKVIDLSADYRLPPAVYEKWYGKGHTDTNNIQKAVYGLPELYRNKIKKADLIANPGCYPTSVILAVAPLIKNGLIEPGGVIADSKSGITGAGRKAAIELLFGEIADNFKAYKIGAHQHMPEMAEVLKDLAGTDVNVLFAPHVIPIKRGILSTVYMKPKKKATQQEVNKAYSDFYKGEFFVRFKNDILPQIKDVSYTNFCDIGVKVTADHIVAVSVIDNLLKGAAGQAVQNMNIMYGLDEKEGLV